VPYDDRHEDERGVNTHTSARVIFNSRHRFADEWHRFPYSIRLFLPVNKRKATTMMSPDKIPATASPAAHFVRIGELPPSKPWRRRTKKG
jgi:hypothetical protein